MFFLNARTLLNFHIHLKNLIKFCIHLQIFVGAFRRKEWTRAEFFLKKTGQLKEFYRLPMRYKFQHAPLSFFYTRYIQLFDDMSEVTYVSLKKRWRLQNTIALYMNF